MRPEDIDDLFKKKLGDLQPAPSAEAWRRLQEQLQPETKKRVIPMWWSVAATLAFLLLMGTFYYGSLRPDATPAPVAQMTQPERGTRPEQSNQEIPVAAPEVTPPTETKPYPDRLAQTDEKDLAGKNNIASAAAPRPTHRPQPKAQIAAAERTQVGNDADRNHASSVNVPAPEQLAMRASTELPSPKTLVAPAPEVMEVVILKNEPTLALAPTADSEATDPETSAKGKVVKGLLRQVRNLANGQHVELPNLNPNNYSIAFETQIGNRKISKTINF